MSSWTLSQQSACHSRLIRFAMKQKGLNECQRTNIKDYYVPQRYQPSLTSDELRRQVEELAPWFHNIALNGIHTAPDHELGDYPAVKWRTFSHLIESDLHGQTVLDIGCNAGFYSVELAKRGAIVTAIDADPRYLAQAKLVATYNELSIEFHQLSIYDISSLKKRFDLVLFLGVLYHLRHPLLALDLLSRYVVKDRLIVQSMLRGNHQSIELNDDYIFHEKDIFNNPAFPSLYFVENQYAGDPTNWWIPNRACLEGMIRSAGFEIFEHPEEEIYFCRKSKDPEFLYA